MKRYLMLSLGAFFLGLASKAQDIIKFQEKQSNGVIRYSQPIITPNREIGEINVLNPSVVMTGERLAMIYRVDAKGVTGSRLQLSFSDDGRTFVPSPANPVLVPDSPFDSKGCEDPRVVLINGTYYLTYVGGRVGAPQCQCLATSTDLIHWDKKGIVLAPEGWNKEQVKAAVLVPEKINGKYIMYFIGQEIPWHPSLGMAISDDLVHWTQPMDHPIMEARPDHFDSMGVEPGPTPIMLAQGILLIYNGWNSGHVHKTGWVLFSKDDPSKILERCEKPFIEPQFKYETKVHRFFTFTEGAVHFQGLWRFYYGASDETIGLAEIDDIETLLKGSP